MNLFNFFSRANLNLKLKSKTTDFLNGKFVDLIGLVWKLDWNLALGLSQEESSIRDRLPMERAKLDCSLLASGHRTQSA